MAKIILLFFSFLVEAVIYWQYTALLFEPKCSAKKKVMMLSLLYMFLFLISLAGKTWLNVSAFFLVNAFLFFTQCSLTILSACFHSVMLTAIMGVSELILYGITLQFAPQFSVNTSENFQLVFFTVFSKLLFFAIIYPLAHIINKRCTTEPAK